MARNEGFLDIDPNTIYFTHSRVRPYFSGCGRRLEETLDDLMNGRMDLASLPIITILRGAGGSSDGTSGHYFSLNNRRLWVLKELRKAGKLPSNLVRVRTKEALPREKDRYTAGKCSLNASIMREGSGADGAFAASDKEVEIDATDASSTKRTSSAAKAHPPPAAPIAWHPKILKQLKALRQVKKERDVQSKIDDLLDEGLITQDQEGALWDLIRRAE